jgi:hypothetical protein
MALVFDLKSITSKLYLSVFVILVFYFLYLTIPDAEFNNVSNQNCKIERLYYTVTNHIGIRENDSLKPLSVRAKVLTMAQIIISYTILLL